MKIFKGLSMGFIALALVVGLGAGKASAISTYSLNNIAESGALTITSAGALGLVAGAFAINIGADATDKTITVGSTTGTSALNLLSGSGGVNITGTLAATSPKFTTSVLDTNGLTILGLSPAASAVNYFRISNSATGVTLSLNAIGTDTNIGMSFNTKGSGAFRFQEQSATGDTIAIAPQTAGGAAQTGTITSADLTASRTYTLQDASGTVPLTTGSGTATVDLASVATAACTADSSNVTVTGAVLGDRVSVSSNTALEAGGFLIGRVTATDTARFQLCNLSGIAIDRASDTYNVKVTR
jgi:hypothetical protein